MFRIWETLTGVREVIFQGLTFTTDNFSIESTKLLPEVSLPKEKYSMLLLTMLPSVFSHWVKRKIEEKPSQGDMIPSDRNCFSGPIVNSHFDLDAPRSFQGASWSSAYNGHG